MQTCQKPFIQHKNNNFALAHLKGKIGQAVIETYLLESGYEIYPYGYENNYANITRFVKKDPLDTTTTKIRSMPDLLVADRDNSERFLLQIKATNTPDESKYWINKDCLDSYVKYWAEALLIVYCIPSGNIYCCRIADIKNLTEGSLPNSSNPGYYLNLADFFDMTKYFRRIHPHPYIELRGEIEDILKAYSRISA